MHILDLFRPKWKQSETSLRLQAVAELEEPETLAEIAVSDPEQEVRVEATRKIDNPDLLARIEAASPGEHVLDIVRQKRNKVLKNEILNANDPETWQPKLQKIDDESVLVDIVLHTDNSELRTAAIDQIADQKYLIKITLSKCGKDAGMKALARIDDEKALKKIADKGSNKAVRNAAGKRLEVETAPQDEVEEKAEPAVDELKEICEYAESVKETYNFDGVGRMLAEKRQRWAELDPNAEHELVARFNEAVETFEKRRAEFEEQQAEQLRRAEEQEALKTKREEICGNVEELDATQDGATEKLEEIKTQWNELEALEDLKEQEALDRRFGKAAKEKQQEIDKLSKDQALLEKLEAKCAEIEAAAQSDDFGELKKSLKTKWKDVDLQTPQVEAMRARFEKAQTAIREKIDKAKEEEARKKQERLDELNKLIEGAKEQVEATDRRAAGSKVKEIQSRWNELDGWKHDKLAAEFKNTLDAFWENQREFHEEQDWNQWANKGIKEELIQIVEKTSEMTDLQKVAKVIRTAQKKWKETGPVPREDSDAMWKRFHKACEENYARCKEFFDEKDQQREGNFEHCTKLCEEAEALVDSEDWKSAVKRFKELQADWKKHGNLPREKGEELYQRFRTACDKFFERFGEHMEEVDANRDENQTQKEELLKKIEALVEAGGIDDARPCLELQNAWREIGPGDREKEQETWDKFRSACDKYFEILEAEREKNVPLKEKLCEEAEALVNSITEDTDRKHVSDKIIDLQKQWKRIGPLPKSKRDELWQRFRKPCEEFFQISPEEYEGDNPKERNLAIKQDLLSQAEELADSDDWREAAEQLKQLQAQWKLVGPVPREHDKETWQRFRTACDTFFNRRKEHFKHLDDRREENLQAKEGLVAQLEMLIDEDKEKKVEQTKSSSSLNLADELQLALESNFAMAGSNRSKFDEVKRIQERWKKIGPVPRDKDKELWNRYRGALDRFYGNRRDNN